MFIHYFKNRWHEETGYKTVLKLALPLILSTGAWSLQQFIDRIFLTWYSAEAIAASAPAGIANFALFSFFIGVGSYVNTFVAQYYGANRPQRVGRAVWQGLYFTIIASLLVVLVHPFAADFFRLVGHPEGVQQQETAYFSMLLFGAPAAIITAVVGSFFSGLGRPWIIFWADVMATLINVVLDYLLIFGRAGFPEMGIAGAGLATVIAVSVSALFLLAHFFSGENARIYATRRAWRYERELFGRLLRYGAPNGLQVVLEVSAFAFFIFLMGRVGVVELAATNIAFNINSLVFMPMIGMMTAVTTLVGQSLGQDKPADAERLTWSAFHIGMTFFASLCFVYFFFPGLFLMPFLMHMDASAFQPVAAIARKLLRFVAVYSIFDAMNMIFSAALKGAGDTRFVAKTTIRLAWLVMTIPSIIAWFYFGKGVFWLWGFVTLYVIGLGLFFLIRFQTGIWKTMRVIEPDVTEDRSRGPLLT